MKFQTLIHNQLTESSKWEVRLPASGTHPTVLGVYENGELTQLDYSVSSSNGVITINFRMHSISGDAMIGFMGVGSCTGTPPLSFSETDELIVQSGLYVGDIQVERDGVLTPMLIYPEHMQHGKLKYTFNKPETGILF